jgi:hypothetical protein
MMKRRRQSDRTGKSALAIEFPDELLALIRKVADRDERSIAFVVRRACIFWLRKSEEAGLLLSDSEPTADALRREKFRSSTYTAKVERVLEHLELGLIEQRLAAPVSESAEPKKEVGT